MRGCSGAGSPGGGHAACPPPGGHGPLALVPAWGGSMRPVTRDGPPWPPPVHRGEVARRVPPDGIPGALASVCPRGAGATLGLAPPREVTRGVPADQRLTTLSPVLRRLRTVGGGAALGAGSSGVARRVPPAGDSASASLGLCSASWFAAHGPGSSREVARCVPPTGRICACLPPTPRTGHIRPSEVARRVPPDGYLGRA